MLSSSKSIERFVSGERFTVVAIDRRDTIWLGLPPRVDFRFDADLIIDRERDMEGEGRSSTLVPGVAGANSDRRGKGTVVGSV